MEKIQILTFGSHDDLCNLSVSVNHCLMKGEEVEWNFEIREFFQGFLFVIIELCRNCLVNIIIYTRYRLHKVTFFFL